MERARHRGVRRLVVADALLGPALLGPALLAPAPAVAAPAVAMVRPPIVRDGRARFEVLTPSLLRLEYARDGRFQDAPTMTAVRSHLPPARFSTAVVHGWRVIRTSRVTLRYRRGSGPFSTHNLRLTLTLDGKRVTVTPSPAADDAGNLGGWTRALDLQTGPVPLHDGLLSRDGWYVVDDTATVLLTHRQPGFAVRPAHAGPYQDWYLFGYGHDYARGLADLRALSGPSPLLPRSAFGVWFSRYYPYSGSNYHTLLSQFRSRRVPLDTLSIDTDFKRENDPVFAAVAAKIAGAPGHPYSWNGWEWDASLFPDPARFIDWAHHQGLSLTLNIHPSIDSNDPSWPETQSQAGNLATDNGCTLLEADLTGHCHVFDWTNPRQLAAYFALQAPFERLGIDFFWLDWCCDASSALAPGLSSDTWINSRYAQRERARGLRWLAFSRIGAAYGPVTDGDRGSGDGGDGAFAEHRYAIQFTGDTCATWPMLAFEARLAASEGNIGLPYVSDDIGSFNGRPVAGRCSASTGLQSEHLPDDLYARWVQFGTFQPLDRLHSNHGDRLPWQYGPATDAVAAAFLRLREALDPYTYTLARRAYDTGLPITGGLYLQWPRRAAAYRHPAEYTFGRDLVVEPVTAAGDPASASVWIPPGSWIDYFTHRRYTGPSARTLSVPLSQMPVLVRAGAIIPTQPYGRSTPPGPRRTLILTVFPGGRGSFRLYDDAGVGFGYAHGQRSFTRLSHSQQGRSSTLRIGLLQGRFRGAPAARSWQVRFLTVARPRVVRVDGRLISRAPVGRAPGWSYDAAGRTLTVATAALATGRPVIITAGPAA